MPPRHKALLAGEIDAGLQSVPWNYVAEEAGMNNLGEASEYVPDWQFVCINVNGQWAAANRDLLVRFLRVMRRGTEWLYANRAGGLRHRRARTAGAAKSRRAGLGFLHRQQCADPRFVGECEGARGGDRDLEGNRPARARGAGRAVALHRRQLSARRAQP